MHGQRVLLVISTEGRDLTTHVSGWNDKEISPFGRDDKSSVEMTKAMVIINTKAMVIIRTKTWTMINTVALTIWSCADGVLVNVYDSVKDFRGTP